MNLSERNVTHGHLLRWLLLAFLVVAFGAARPAHAQVTSSAITVSGDDVQATFTNKGCTDTVVGLATYCIPASDPLDTSTPAKYHSFLNAQVLYCYTQGTVKAGKCLTLSVDIPWTCQCPNYQADTFTGCVIPKFYNDDYGTRFLQGIVAPSYNPWSGWGW